MNYMELYYVYKGASLLSAHTRYTKVTRCTYVLETE